MEIIGITTTIVFVSIVWFFIVLSVSKALNIKKDAPISKIMCCLSRYGTHRMESSISGNCLRNKWIRPR